MTLHRAPQSANQPISQSANGPLRLAVFASGGGSNLQAILDATSDGSLNAEVALVVSDRPGTGALDRAEQAGVPRVVLRPADFADSEAFGAALLEAVEAEAVSFIALAGYLKQVPGAVVQAFRGRILNVHPSLLPAFGGPGFYGRRVHEAALAHGVRWSGATVHLVDEAYDTGPIVLQEPVPVRADGHARDPRRPHPGRRAPALPRGARPLRRRPRPPRRPPRSNHE